MCGIAGYWQLLSGRLDAIGMAMQEAIRHRGPDDMGIMVDEEHGLVLAHRRLAIVDPSATGHQPMRSRNGRYDVIFNGEIYNFIELRKRLIERGFSFTGTSDTEVLLAGFEEWGVEQTIRRCAGMFAIGIWEREAARLTLVRDRIGKKPLYMARVGDAFAFASEVKAISAIPGFSSPLSTKALFQYLRTGYVSAPESIFAAVHQVPPGHIAEITHADEAPLVREYWRPPVPSSTTTGPSPLTTADVEEVIDRAVMQRMIADVPLGAFLSGGIDSSLVVAYMNRHSNEPVKTFTIGFEESAYDEADYAGRIAKHLETDHHVEYVTPAQAQAVIQEIPRIWDEPFADSSQIPTLLVSRMARKHVTVALSGDGGDELFGGYNRYIYGQAVWARMAWLGAPGRRLLGRMIRRLPYNIIEKGAGAVQTVLPKKWRVVSPGEKVLKLGRILCSESAPALYHELTSLGTDPHSILRRDYSGSPRHAPLGGQDFRAFMMGQDQIGYLPNDILVKVDRASMAVSLEARAPLLDHRVIELSSRLPLDMKIRGSTGKWVLRELLAREVPRELFERPKQGFGIPLAEWLRDPLRPWAESLLSSERIRDDNLLDPVAVQRLWDEHQSGKHNWQAIIWDILMLQAWLDRHREHIDRDGAAVSCFDGG